MNIAIHGEKELLVRLRDDLSTKGYKRDVAWDNHFWNHSILPNEDSEGNYLLIDENRNISCHNHPGGDEFDADLHHLTPSNYNEILNIIIERKDEVNPE